MPAVTTAPAQTKVASNGKNQVVKYVATVNYEYKNGYVCGVEPEVGKIIDALDDYQITVYYAYNPVYSTIAIGSQTGTTMSQSPLSTGASTASPTTKTTAKQIETETQPPVTKNQTEAPPPVTQQTDPPVVPDPVVPDPPPASVPDPTPTNPDPPAPTENG